LIAAPELITPVNVSLAGLTKIGERITFPRVVIVTGKAPAKFGTAELVVKVVWVNAAFVVAVLRPGPLPRPKARMAAAFAEVAMASEAKPAIANPISLECTVLLLRL